MKIRKLLFMFTLVLVFASQISALTAMDPVDQKLIEEARPQVETAPDRFFIEAPFTNKLVVMVVRVYNEQGESVLSRRSRGEPLSLYAADLPDGEYRYQIKTIFDLDEAVGEGPDYREQGMHKNFGRFTIEHGVITQPESGEPGEHLGFLGSVLKGALGVLVSDASAQNLLASNTQPTVFFNDTNTATHSVEWWFVASADSLDRDGSFKLVEMIGPTADYSYPIIINTLPDSQINNSWVVEGNGDMSWGNGALTLNRFNQNLALGWSTTEADFSIASNKPEITLVHDAGGAQSIWQLDASTVRFWTLPSADDTYRSPMTINVNAADGSLGIADGGKVSMVQGLSVGTAIQTGGTILSIGNAGSSRAQMEFIASNGSAFIQWAGNDWLQFEGSGGTAVSSLNMGAPVDSLVMTDLGRVGLGTGNPLKSLHVRRSDGSAEIMVEEFSGVQQARDLFTIRNNGNPEFRMTNSGNNNSWVFSAGLRFVVKNNAGDWVSRITASGNMEITGLLTESSDVNGKQDIEPVDGRNVLEKLANLKVSEWSYKDTPTDRHVGPMAQDFYAAFGLGHTDKGIATLDTSGVALAAIKALIEQNQSLAQRVNELEQQNQRIEELVMRMVMDRAEAVAMK